MNSINNITAQIQNTLHTNNETKLNKSTENTETASKGDGYKPSAPNPMAMNIPRPSASAPATTEIGKSANKSEFTDAAKSITKLGLVVGAGIGIKSILAATGPMGMFCVLPAVMLGAALTFLVSGDHSTAW